jgi:nucleotide-binding universal stress UspA family protein
MSAATGPGPAEQPGVRPTRVLVAVHDSVASLRAARLAVGVAATAGCPLQAVTVVQDGAIAHALRQASTVPRGEERRAGAAAAVLRHVLAMARTAGVAAEGRQLTGLPGPELLKAARDWGADLIVVGRCEAPNGTHGQVGDVARHVMELADVPVLLVP